MTGDDRPAIGTLGLELAAAAILLGLALVVLVRARGTVDDTRIQLRVERNKRLEAEDLAEKREKSIDGVLDTLKEANDRTAALTQQLARHERIADAPLTGPAHSAGSAGTSGSAAADGDPQ